MRRLALIGLLVFFSDGIVLQTIVASLIALVSLYMYTKYRPYLYQRADGLAPCIHGPANDIISSEFESEQPTKKTWLFAGLLLRAEIAQKYTPVAWITATLLVGNLKFERNRREIDPGEAGFETAENTHFTKQAAA